jgi:hypothetical protein
VGKEVLVTNSQPSITVGANVTKPRPAHIGSAGAVNPRPETSLKLIGRKNEHHRFVTRLGHDCSPYERRFYGKYTAFTR